MASGYAPRAGSSAAADDGDEAKAAAALPVNLNVGESSSGGGRPTDRRPRPTLRATRLGASGE